MRAVISSLFILMLFLPLSNRGDPVFAQIKGGQKGDESVRLGVQMVSLTVTVSDSDNRLVSGLTKDNFKVFEDGIEQKIELFSDENGPTSFGIILDISGSMKEKIQKAKIALRKLMDYSRPEDDFFILGFNESVQIIYDFSPGSTNLGRLDLIQADGETALFDAVFMGLEKIKQAKFKDRLTLIVISDGQDNKSRYSLNEIKEKLKEPGVIIYCIGVVSATDEVELIQQGIRNLIDLADISAGSCFVPSASAWNSYGPYNNELESIVTRISLEMRYQYSIGYYPTSGQSTKRDWHKIKVEARTKGKKLYVRARPGYYGPLDK